MSLNAKVIGQNTGIGHGDTYVERKPGTKAGRLACSHRTLRNRPRASRDPDTDTDDGTLFKAYLICLQWLTCS